jgi:hypothetical protein
MPAYQAINCTNARGKCNIFFSLSKFLTQPSHRKRKDCVNCESIIYVMTSWGLRHLYGIMARLYMYVEIILKRKHFKEIWWHLHILHLHIFWSELFVWYPQWIKMTTVFENAHAKNRYTFLNRSNYPDFPNIRCIFYLEIKFSLWPHPSKITKFSWIFSFFRIDSN